MQQQQQRRQQRQQQGSSSRGAASSGVALSAAETIVVRQLWIALVGPQRRGNYQRCLHLLSLPLLLLLLLLLLLRLRWLWARLICVNRVSYASTIMKTLLTCILVELWDETSLYLALSFALSLSLFLSLWLAPSLVFPAAADRPFTYDFPTFPTFTHTHWRRGSSLSSLRGRGFCAHSLAVSPGWAWACSGLHLEHRVRWTVSSFVGDLPRHILFAPSRRWGWPLMQFPTAIATVQLCNCATMQQCNCNNKCFLNDLRHEWPRWKKDDDVASFFLLPAVCLTLSLIALLIMPTITSHNLPFAYRGTPIRQPPKARWPSPVLRTHGPSPSSCEFLLHFNVNFQFPIFNFLNFIFILVFISGNRIGRFRLPATNRLRQLMERVSAAMSAIFSCLQGSPTSNVGSVIDAASWADMDNSVKWAELLCSCERS